MNTRTRTRRAVRRGFTLLEVMIVIGIILAIGGLVLVNVLGASERADQDQMRIQIQSFEQAMDMFKYDMKRWPSEDEGLTVLWSKDALDDEEEASRWKGPYLKEPSTKDTWNNDWVYYQPSQVAEGLDYDIVSPGPDREEGTEDDITNHDDKLGEDGELDESFDDFTDDGLDG